MNNRHLFWLQIRRFFSRKPFCQRSKSHPLKKTFGNLALIRLRRLSLRYQRYENVGEARLVPTKQSRKE